MIMFEDVRKNKMKSIFIIFGFILMITLIVYYISIAFDLDAPVALTIALLFSIISSWSSYFYSDKIILAVSHARPATEKEDKKLVNILHCEGDREDRQRRGRFEDQRSRGSLRRNNCLRKTGAYVRKRPLHPAGSECVPPLRRLCGLASSDGSPADVAQRHRPQRRPRPAVAGTAEGLHCQLPGQLRL